MTIDFHVHGKITNKFPFDKEKFLLIIEEAKSQGIDSLSVTEHFHSKNFLEGYEFLNENYQQIEDYYNVNGFKIFYGMEVTTKQNLDILIVGNPSLILNLRTEIINNLNKRKFIDINELFKVCNPNELLIIIAHPYRNHTVFPKLDKQVLSKIDAIELNAKDLYKNGIENMKKKVQDLANILNLPIVCGSDAHHFIQMGSVKNVFDLDFNSIKGIKKTIKKGKYHVKISQDLSIRVRSAIIIKHLICN